MDLKAIADLELAAFAAFPALEELDWQGWRLRFAQGYTKRANSANPLASARELTAQDLQVVTQAFHDRHLPVCFRLPAPLCPPNVDDLLARHGYGFVDMSLVMTKRLTLADPPVQASTHENADGFDLALLPDLSEWHQQYLAISGKPMAGQAIHAEMLRSIQHDSAFALARHDGRPACCGLAVCSGTTLGLFDIATHGDHRKRGLASRLCQALMSWGHQRGARLAYLQVLAANSPAISVYEHLGFRRAYHYWYRVAPEWPALCLQPGKGSPRIC